MTSKLTEDLKTKLLARLASEPSDTKLSLEFDVSRKSIWRLRQDGSKPKAPKEAKVKTPKVKAPKPEKSVRTLPEVVADPESPLLTGEAFDQLVRDSEPPPPKQKLLKQNKLRDRKVTTLPPASMVPEVKVPALAPLPKVTLPPVLKAPESASRPVAISAAVDITPKVDTIHVDMSTYFAVQLLKGENYKHVAQEVLKAADKKGILFRKLQVLDVNSVGTGMFVRFRSDMPDAFAVISSLKNRGIAHQIGGSYVLQFVDGRTGKFSTSTMCGVGRGSFGQTFVGTKIKRWAQQFEAA